MWWEEGKKGERSRRGGMGVGERRHRNQEEETSLC